MMTDPIIDPELARFLQSGVAIEVASRNSGNVPCVVRGIGCRVSEDRRRVTLFMRVAQCGPLLSDLASNGAIAMVACLPSTHRTVQLKGADARQCELEPDDPALMARRIADFHADLVSIGFDPSLPGALAGSDADETVAVTFTPLSVFVQTPGPGAGALLAGRG